MPQGWSRVWWGSAVPSWGYPVTGNGGSKAASVTYTATTNGDARWAHTPVAVEPGATYQYSNWYKSNVETEVDVEYTHTNGSKSWGWIATVPSSGDTWKQVTGSVTIPTGVSKAVVYHLLDRPGTLSVDDFSLVKGGSTPPPSPTQPTVSLSANPASITSGQSSTLSWTSSNATSCTASGAWSGAKNTSGSEVVAPAQTATYSITCAGASGTTPATASASVTVGTTPPPPTGGFTEGMVSLTFDDSWLSQYQNALPRLDRAGYKGTFYLTSEPIEGGWSGFMTPAQVKNIASRGHEIAGHSVTHADLTTLSAQQLQDEIVNSKNYLQNLTQKNVTTFAYPYGSTNSTVQTALKNAGYTSARGVDYSTHNTATSEIYNLKSQCIETSDTLASIRAKIDSAKANKQWYILCFHEVKSSGDQWNTTPARFQAIIDYLKQSGIKVVTVAEGRALMSQ